MSAELSREEKNRLILKACGYVPCDQWQSFIAGASMMKGQCGHEKCYPATWPTDYFKSLHACHEMEKAIINDISKWNRYANELTIVSSKSGNGPFHAAASERAESFGRTMGLWT